MTMKKILAAILLVALLIPGTAIAVSLHSAIINNNALVFYDTYRMRWIDAIGPDVIKYVQDFASLDSDTPALVPTEWTEAPAGASTARISTVAGGELIITTGGTDNNGVNLQIKGAAFKLEDGMPLYFGCRIKISEATQSDLLIGVCITDTTLLAGMTDGLYFEKLDAGTGVSAVTEDAAQTQTDDCAIMDTSYHIYEIVADGVFTTAYTSGTVKFYIDGGLVATHTATANITTDAVLTPSIEFLTGDNAAETAEVDWIRVIQLR